MFGFSVAFQNNKHFPKYKNFKRNIFQNIKTLNIKPSYT